MFFQRLVNLLYDFIEFVNEVATIQSFFSILSCSYLTDLLISPYASGHIIALLVLGCFILKKIPETYNNSVINYTAKIYTAAHLAHSLKNCEINDTPKSLPTTFRQTLSKISHFFRSIPSRIYRNYYRIILKSTIIIVHTLNPEEKYEDLNHLEKILQFLSSTWFTLSMLHPLIAPLPIYIQPLLLTTIFLIGFLHEIYIPRLSPVDNASATPKPAGQLAFSILLQKASLPNTATLYEHWYCSTFNNQALKS